MRDVKKEILIFMNTERKRREERGRIRSLYNKIDESSILIIKA